MFLLTISEMQLVRFLSEREEKQNSPRFGEICKTSKLIYNKSMVFSDENGLDGFDKATPHPRYVLGVTSLIFI